MKRKSPLMAYLMLALTTGQAQADSRFVISPSLGMASVDNIGGYEHAKYVRLDAGYLLSSTFQIGLFGIQYTDFDSNGSGNPIAIKVNGRGTNLTARWPLAPHVQPFVRLDYLFWTVESEGADVTLGKDNGSSAGYGLGVRFPVDDAWSVRLEATTYDKVSDADLRQYAFGVSYAF